MRLNEILSTALLGLALVASAGCEDEEDSSAGSTQQGQTDCTNDAENPYADTCVETFLTDCFDPSGACTGEVDLTGSVTLEWASGATVQTDVIIDATNITPGQVPDQSSAEANTTLTGSGGQCATGQTRNMVDGCASRTIYTRSSDNMTMTFCIKDDESVEVTCPDGTTFTAEQDAPDCQWGSGSEGGCTIEEPDTSDFGFGDLPGT